MVVQEFPRGPSWRFGASSFPSGKRGTRVAFLRHPKRTAMSLPADVINKSIGDMKKRCKLLVDAQGGQIEG